MKQHTNILLEKTYLAKAMYFFIVMIIVSCGEKTESNKQSPSTVIAKVNNSELLLSDFENRLPKELTGSDSVAFIKNAIKKWASEEEFYLQALNYLSSEELDVEKELETYKKELISYKFQLKLINEKLDTLISPEQIQEYYDANQQNFLLKNNIVKVLYIKTPNNIPNIDKFKKLCYESGKAKEALQLKSLCVQYANNYYMNDNTWLLFDDLKKEMLQLKEVPDYTVQKGKIVEFTDATSFYFLKIIDVKSKNTLSPLNFEKNNIKNMLINQRKQLLINNIKKDFFEKALSSKEIAF